jgi:hypothetical protein
MHLQSMRMQQEEEEDQNRKNVDDNADQSHVTEVGRGDSTMQGIGTDGDPGLVSVKTGEDQNLLRGTLGQGRDHHRVEGGPGGLRLRTGI